MIPNVTKSSTLRLALFLAFAGSAAGQFYAPETSFHDVVQRRYPVECVRVMLAWQEVLSGRPARGQTVEAGLEATQGRHLWTVTITGETGGKTRLVTIEYPDSRLREGPKYFRDAAEQVARQLEIRPASGKYGLSEDYWTGAALSRPSRESSLTNAFVLADALTPSNSVSTAAQLAGLLAHACPPPQAGRVTLDGLLLARAAAWLALAEQVSGTSEEALWTPLLHQSMRGPGADEAWKRRPNAWTNQPMVRVWDVRMSRPNTQSTYLAACDGPSASLSAALLFANAVDEQTWPLLEDALPMIFPGKGAPWTLHNYAPVAAVRGSVGLGHYFGAGPLLQRLAWLDLFQRRRMEPEFAPFRNVVAECSRTLQTRVKETPQGDASLVGLEAMAPLYRLAEKNSGGPLRATVVATVSDLAGYGWEMAGWQLGARYRFLNSRYGSQEDSRPVRTGALQELESWSPFFETSREGDGTRRAAMDRLQYVTETMRFAGQKLPPFSAPEGARNPAATARRLVQTCWMEPLFVSRYTSLLGASGQHSEITPTLERFLEEGGFLGVAPLINYLEVWKLEDMEKSNPELPPFRWRIAKLAPQPNQRTYGILQSGNPKGPRDLAEAQEAERLYWRNTDSGLEETVFDAYALAGYPGEARRFYFRVRAHLGDPVEVSNGIGESAWLLGLALNDPKLREAALQDSASGSASDLQLQTWDAAFRGDLKAFRESIQERLDRYPGSDQRSGWEHILQFADFVPSLGNAGHPDRAKALHYFGRSSEATMLRWIWIQRYHLPANDAIRFLGGREPDAIRKVFVCVLEKDLPGAGFAVAELQNSSAGRGSYAIVAIHARDQLRGSPRELTADLMPSDARFTRDLVKERTGKRR